MSPASRTELPDELLLPLACARLQLGCGGPELLAPFANQSFDWELVLQASRWHRLHIILHKQLSLHAPELMPDWVSSALCDEIRLNATRHLILVTWLIRVSNALKEAGIPILCMKGAPLASTLYTDPSLRPSQDLDLLVAPENLNSAMEVLGGLGFAHMYGPVSLHEKLQRRIDYEVDLADERVRLDLHWHCGRFPEMFPRDEAAMFQRAEQFDLAGTPVTVFNPTDRLIYLAFHGAKHLWMRWFWLADMVGLAATVQDWSALLARADERGQTHSVVLGYYLAEVFLGFPMPQPLRAHMEEKPVLTRLCQQMLHFQDQQNNTQVRPFEVVVSRRNKTRWTMNLQTSRMGAFRVFWRFLCQPAAEDLKALRLPRPLFALYYLFRPLRLAFGELKKSD